MSKPLSDERCYVCGEQSWCPTCGACKDHCMTTYADDTPCREIRRLRKENEEYKKELTRIEHFEYAVRVHGDKTCKKREEELKRARELLEEVANAADTATAVYPDGHPLAGTYIVATDEYERLGDLEGPINKIRALLDGEDDVHTT